MGHFHRFCKAFGGGSGGPTELRLSEICPEISLECFCTYCRHTGSSRRLHWRGPVAASAKNKEQISELGRSGGMPLGNFFFFHNAKCCKLGHFFIFVRLLGGMPPWPPPWSRLCIFLEMNIKIIWFFGTLFLLFWTYVWTNLLDLAAGLGYKPFCCHPISLVTFLAQ